MTGATVDALDVVLAIAVVLTAATALVLPRRGAAVMTFLVLGVLLALVWARLGAPDVALAEAAIASGVTGALLVAALTETREPPDRGTVPGRPRLLAWFAGLGAVVLASTPVAIALVTASPDLGSHLGPTASRTVDEAAVSHPVTAVLLEFRAYDTLLEVAVLAVAALAALVLHRDGTLRDVPATADRRPALVGLVRLVAPAVLLLAGWLLVAGSSRPGGAFQSGAMLTGLLLVLHLTGHRPRVPTGRWLRPLLLVGLVAFMALGATTAVLGGRWLAVDGPGAGTVILLLEGILAVGIGLALATLVLAGRADTTAPRPDSGAGATPTRAPGGAP